MKFMKFQKREQQKSFSEFFHDASELYILVLDNTVSVQVYFTNIMRIYFYFKEPNNVPNYKTDV